MRAPGREAYRADAVRGTRIFPRRGWPLPFPAARRTSETPTEKHTMKKLRTLGVGAAGAMLFAMGTVHAADCGSLAGQTIADSTVTLAEVVPANTTVPTPNGNNGTAPVSYCRVAGTASPSADSAIKWEVWLPLTQSAWTGRMKVDGTGGYSGATPYARLAQDVGDGFVAAGSNMGHDGGESATWTMGHPEKVRDWGVRAHYSVATAAKTLARMYYGAEVQHSYFEGCSNGGRQAMMMAQNYPDLF